MRGRVTQAARATSPLSPDGTGGLAIALAINLVINKVRHRIRLQRVIYATALAGLLALTLLGLERVQAKLEYDHSALNATLRWLTLTLPTFVISRAALQRVPSLCAAALIDRSHGLADLMSSAWSFSRLPEHARSRFATAAMLQAAAVSSRVVPKLAQPLSWPRELALWPLLGCGVLLLSSAPTAKRVTRAPHEHASSPQVAITAAELSGHQRELARLQRELAGDPTLTLLADEFARLLGQLAQHRPDRRQLLRALDELERRALGSAQHSDDDALDLRALGQALARMSVTRTLGAALATADWTAAKRALEQLAERARNAATPNDKQELEKLRAALRSALSQTPSRSTQRAATPRRTLDSLQREREDSTSDASQGATQQPQPGDALRAEREKRQAERELDHLERDLERASSGKRGDAAATTAENLQAAAGTLESLQRDKQRDRTIERLQQSLAKLRQQLSESGTATKSGARDERGQESRAARLTRQRFEQRAADPSWPRPQAASGAEPTTPSAAVLQEHPQSADAAARDRTLGAQRVSEQAGPSREGRPVHGPATRSGQADVDLALPGVLGRGPSRRSVIYTAAAQGFGTLGYQRVHADYATHAEAELEREPLPAGYRRYVQRYFDLIQPREDSHE
jgi:hypothetical protein